MTDFLHPRMTPEQLLRISALGLAHIGDGVYEIMTRGYLVSQGLQTARNLHKETTLLVCAASQHRAALRIEPLLTEAEADVFRKGRNAKPKSIPKAASRAEYAYATALETLFGWLYLQGEYERLNALYDEIRQDFPAILGQ